MINKSMQRWGGMQVSYTLHVKGSKILQINIYLRKNYKKELYQYTGMKTEFDREGNKLCIMRQKVRITFSVERLLHFALKMLLHFGAILSASCVSNAICGDYYISRRNSGVM